MPGLFYIDALPGNGELAVLDGDEGFHAATVRRIRVGEELILGDGAGSVARCVVEETARDGLRARVVEPPPRRARHAAGDRGPGAAQIRALRAGRSSWPPRPAPTRWWPGRPRAAWPAGTVPAPSKGLRRWRAVARAAAQQSRRAYIPSVDGVLSTAALVTRIGEVTSSGGVVLALHEAADGPLTDLHLAQAASLMLVVGPEGGIAA